jgi:lysophospholipase L1-like esterase
VVEGIQQVFINGQPTVGQGEQQLCPTLDPQSQPLLRVILTDDSLRELSLPVGFTVRSPVFWFAILLSACSLLVAVLSATRNIWRPLQQPTRKIWTLIWSTLGVVLLICVLMEWGLRWYFTHYGTERERIIYVYSRAEILQRQRQYQPMPYVNYVPSPAWRDHDTLGYRGPAIVIPKPQGTFRIVALGGSTTYSTATTAEEAYPAQLQNILQEQYGLSNIEVINAGVPGFTSWDTLVNYMFRVSELDPDMLIFYEGFNDVEPRTFDPLCYQGLNPTRGINPMRGIYEPISEQSFSTLYRVVALAFGLIPDISTVTGGFQVNLPCTEGVKRDSNVALNPPIYFERNLRRLIQVIQGDDRLLMFSTWTYFPEGERSMIPDPWRPGIDEHNAIMRQLATEFDIPLFDLAATEFGNEANNWALPDPIHMSAVGTREQARLYADFITTNGMITPDR